MNNNILREKITLIGAGRLGRALLRMLIEHQYSVSAVIDVDEEALNKCNFLPHNIILSQDFKTIPNETTCLLIAVPDDSIEEVAKNITNCVTLTNKCVAAHTSGAHTSDILEALKTIGISTGSLHPIQTFPGNDDDWQRLKKIYFSFEGDETAYDRFAILVETLGSKIIKIEKKYKTLYHISCVMASNYLVALLHMATQLAEKSGVQHDEILKVLNPLINATLENISSQDITYALTGPIARGDVGTIIRHITALQNEAARLLPCYLELGKITLDIAKAGSSHLPDLAKMEQQLL